MKKHVKKHQDINEHGIVQTTVLVDISRVDLSHGFAVVCPK